MGVLHGREADLARVDDTLGALSQRRGRALFLTGEAGIGKSTVLTEARLRAPGDALVLSGAAWEAGGAPPYWPWQQVLSDAEAQLGPRVRTLPGADRIASLIASWGDGTSRLLEAPDGAAARFALLDAVVRALLAIAAERPVVIVLDDLHAADLPSLDLLALFARELPRAPIALFAAWREGELAVRTDAAQRLARATRAGHVQPLRRLTADEVARWVGTDAQSIFASSEGNPLFVEELLRARSGGTARALTSVLAEHLALASAPTQRVLSVASILGRDIEPRLVAELTDMTVDAIEAALHEGAATGIVERRDRAWRFRHILLRDQLYTTLPASERAALHRRAGELLERIDATRAAHHQLAGIADTDVERAVAAARHAAAHASKLYAFEDAAELLDAAVRALALTPHERGVLAIDVRTDLAAAQHHIGKSDAARANCVRAAELSRMHADAERLARAAMVYAQELFSGGRDPTMIALLEEARGLLPPDDSPTRARVTARLAAALVPGPEREILRAQTLARESVAMARRIGDPATTMFALRYALHAHSYQIPVSEALELARETIALSEQVGNPLESIDHRAFVSAAHLALGDRAASDAALEGFAALVTSVPQPHYRWRLPAMRCAWATLSGRFADAERQLGIVHELAREYDLQRAAWASRFGQLGLVAATRDPARALAHVDDIRRTHAQIGPPASGIVAFVLAVGGQIEEARAELARTHFIPALVVIQFAAEAIALTGARDLAGRVLPMLESQARMHGMAIGSQAAIVMRPGMQALGELYALLGEHDKAIAALEDGLALARKLDALPYVALGAASLADVLVERGAAGDVGRAAALQDEAKRLASELGVTLPPSRTSTAPANTVTAGTDRGITIRCNGEHARVSWAGRELQVPVSKGFEFLAVLVETPHREVHVSDLVGDDDRGDAGEVFDAKARAAYKARAEELQAELESARSRNDLGRVERLAAELEAITDELLAGTGLGGRTRKAGSRVERARVNVQRRIKDAIRRLAAEDAELGRYLEATIRTGTFCSFVPMRT